MKTFGHILPPSLIGVISLFALAAFSAVAKVPLPGDQAPPFSGRDSSGKMLYSSDFFSINPAKSPGSSGSAVILIFSSKGCAPCERMLPAFLAFYRKWHPVGVEMIMIRWKDQPEDLQSYCQEHKIPFPVLGDLYGKIKESYGVTGFPRTFILNASGKIIQMIIGEDLNLNATLEKEMLTMGIKAR